MHNSDPSSLHVVTENGEQCFVWQHNRLTYIAQDRQELPLVLGLKFGNLATKLDLSYNTLTSYKNINLFTNLNELILDNNCLEDDHLDFKQNLRLKILSLNKNKLVDLCRLISTIKICFPNLEFLSLIGNPLCPTPIVSSMIEEHSRSFKEGAQSANNSLPSEPKGKWTPGYKQASTSSAATSVDHESAISLIAAEQSADFASQKYRYYIIYHLPNLRFLDSSTITNQERDEALRRCYWMENITLSTSHQINHRQQSADLTSGQICETQNNPHTNNNSVNKIVDRAQNSSVGQQQPTEGYHLERFQRAMPNNDSVVQQQPKGAFARLSYKYTGKNSEGNRFIRNNDL